MPGGRRPIKRGSEWVHGDGEGDTVDDLAHAATFALLTAVPYVATDNRSALNKCDVDAKASVVDEDVVDNDNISLDSSTQQDHVDSEGHDSNGADLDSSSSSDSDDQSDLDLAVDLAQMGPDEHLDEEDYETGYHNGVSLPPKTANEVDAYRTPIQELEQHLQFQLTVGPDGSNAAIATQNLATGSVRLAGKIKHYMALDRTVVVESAASNPHGNANYFSTENAPLDEGTLLLLQPPTSIFTGKEDTNEVLYIPLGRIFEVFGPVSNPLYTIRLSAKMIEHKHDSTSKSGQPRSGAESSKEQDKGIQSAGLKVIPGMNTSSEPSQSAAHIDDPWAMGGKYAILLQQNNALPVYYVRDEAKLIDMGFIAKISRKGCDASNLYDEEVVNSSEMYYSDDEEERQAKTRRKRGANQPHGQKANTDITPLSPSSGFHADAPSSRPTYQATPLPEGFHQMSTLLQNRAAPTGLYATNPGPGGYTNRRDGQPPPPPPPTSAGAPPAYEY